jgi:hypothetical protein
MAGRVRAECFICGLDFWQDEMVQHYKLLRLVDVDCADDISHTDLFSMMWPHRGAERMQRSQQPVPFQGEQPQPPEAGQWYTSGWYVSKWGAR